MKEINFLWRESYIDFFWATETTAKTYFIDSGYLIYDNGILSAYATDKEIEMSLLSTKHLIDSPEDILVIKKHFKEVKNKIDTYHKVFSNIKLEKITNKDLYNIFLDISDIYRDFISAYRFTEPHMIDHVESKIKRIVNKNFKKNSNKVLADILSNPNSINNYKLEKNKNIFNLVSEVAKIRFKAKKLTDDLSEDAEGLLFETSRRTNFAVNQISSMSIKEIEDILVNKKDVDIYQINKRVKSFGLSIKVSNSGVKITPVSDKKIKDIESTFTDSSKIIKGDSVYPGVVKGDVRIVPKLFSQKEYDKFISTLKKTDIIVAAMTSPAITNAFSLVKGVVTDEGGLMSHAALVSREKKIPCVVGTRNSTLKLKDGDRIELNADDGIITII